MKIFLNPGHSVADPGAISCTGLPEAAICLDIAERVARLLNAQAAQVLVFRHDSLAEVCRLSNRMPGDLFVSIHANSFGSQSAQGAECFYLPGSKAGQTLAMGIQSELVIQLPLVNRGCKEADFYVLRQTLAPACLVELAFLSNPRDEWLLRSRPQEFARALATGIMNFSKG